MANLREMIEQEFNKILENSPGSKKPPQVTDKILPDSDTESKVYGGSTLDLDVVGKPNNPKKLGARDVYKPARDKQSKENLSEGLHYHLKHAIPFDDNVYRPGTRKFFDLMNEARSLWESGNYSATPEEYELFTSDIGKWGIYEGQRVPLDFPMWDEDLNEAKYKGREVKLGTAGASQSGGRAHVYVRNPKTGKIKKVSFGSGMPDAMGDSPKHRARRRSFGARHGCSKNKNKLSASYWACRATKMFGRKVAGWW
jgi:hypothetical protein